MTKEVQQDHPIRRLVCPEIEEPIGDRDAFGERRQSHRYARKLPGRMNLGDKSVPITCVDIGYGGVGVVAPLGTPVSPGDQADIKIRLGARLFKDRFSIVHARATEEGTNVHLQL